MKNKMILDLIHLWTSDSDVCVVVRFALASTVCMLVSCMLFSLLVTLVITYFKNKAK